MNTARPFEDGTLQYPSAPVRARIGFIIPSSNRLVEPQFNRYAPDGVVPHVTRLRMTGPHRKPIQELLPTIGEAAAALGDARCDAIVFQCTATSMEVGASAEREIVDTMERGSGRPATTTASAVLAALTSLGVRRLVVVSPYIRDTHEPELSFLSDAGYEIVGERALGLNGSDAYCAAAAELWRDTVLAMRDEQADAYFISCANIHSIDVIGNLEEALNRPVITSNQVALWQALRIAGVQDRIPELGRLFDASP